MTKEKKRNRRGIPPILTVKSEMNTEKLFHEKNTIKICETIDAQRLQQQIMIIQIRKYSSTIIQR